MGTNSEMKNRIDNLPLIRKIEMLSKTASAGEQYRLYSYFGRSYLLKIIPGKQEKVLLENRLWLSEGLPVQRIHRTGTTKDGETYTLSQWIPGNTLDEVFPCGSYAEERELGIRCGNLLKKIHSSLPKYTDLHMIQRLEERLDNAEKRISSEINTDGAETLLNAVHRLQREVSSLEDGPCFRLHGDYHTGNLVLDRSERLHILDPVYGSAGAPEEDHARVLVSAEHSKIFARGQIESYYTGNIPEWFWGRLRFYILLHLVEAWSFGEGKGSSAIFKDLLRITEKQYPQLLSGNDIIIKKETPLFWRNADGNR